MRYAEDRTHKCHAYGKQRFGNIVYTNRCKKKKKKKKKRDGKRIRPVNFTPVRAASVPFLANVHAI